MAGGGIIRIVFDELENVQPDSVGSGPGVGVAEQSEQGTAETDARFHLSRKEIQQLGLVHLHHFQRPGDFRRRALPHAGQGYGSLPAGKHAGQLRG